MAEEWASIQAIFAEVIRCPFVQFSMTMALLGSAGFLMSRSSTVAGEGVDGGGGGCSILVTDSRGVMGGGVVLGVAWGTGVALGIGAVPRTGVDLGGGGLKW